MGMFVKQAFTFEGIFLKRKWGFIGFWSDAIFNIRA
jgi:hypothetical protein